jgi:hypothetical protein
MGYKWVVHGIYMGCFFTGLFSDDKKRWLTIKTSTKAINQQQ